MDETKALLTNLILSVCRLCDETRELATSESKDEVGLELAQAAAHQVSLAIGQIRETWAAESLPPVLPVERLGEATEENWLLGDE